MGIVAEVVTGITVKLGTTVPTDVVVMTIGVGGGSLMLLDTIIAVVDRGMVDVVVVVYESPKETIVDVDVELVVSVAITVKVVVPGSSSVGGLPLHLLSSPGLETHLTQE